MTKKFRFMVRLLAVVLAVVMLSSAVYIAVEADHDCSGDDCAICRQISICENLLKSLDADLYDCVISAVGTAQWNKTHYSYTRSYADIASVKDQIEGESQYTELAVFTKKGSSLRENLDAELEKLLKNGKVKEISEKYFQQDISAETE